MFKSIIFTSLLLICSSTIFPVRKLTTTESQRHWICTHIPSDEWTSRYCAHGPTFDATGDIYGNSTHVIHEADDVSTLEDVHQALTVDTSMDIALMILNMPDSMRIAESELHIMKYQNWHDTVDHGTELVIDLNAVEENDEEEEEEEEEQQQQETEEAGEEEEEEEEEERSPVIVSVVSHHEFNRLQYLKGSSCKQVWITSEEVGPHTIFQKHCKVCGTFGVDC